MYKGYYNFEEVDGIWIIQESIPEGTAITMPLDTDSERITVEPERFALRIQLGSTETESFARPYMGWLNKHGAVKVNVAHFVNDIYRNGVPHHYTTLIEARGFGGDVKRQCFGNCSVCGGELSYYMCRANCNIMHLVGDALSGLKMLCIQGSMKEEGSVHDHYCWPTQAFIDRLYKPHNPVDDTVVQFHTQPLQPAS
jgi:hypothetical protein